MVFRYLNSDCLRRLIAALIFAGWQAGAAPSQAQTWPNRPITMIVPFAPGGSTDAIARIVAEGMRPSLGQPLVIENRGAAGGSVGTQAVARAPADGYTIGMGSASTMAINPNVYRRLSYDVTRDLAPIVELAEVPNIMAINASLPAADMAAFIAFARSKSQPLNYGSAGIGSVAHLMGEQFSRATGVPLVHVPYRGMGAALTDAVAGQVQVIFDNLPTTLPLVLGGQLRALAVSSPRRLPDLPDVPTFAELGLADLDWRAFFGLVAPAGTPDAVIAKLNAAANSALIAPTIEASLKQLQAQPVGGPPEAFRALIARENARHKATAAAAGIVLD